MIQFSDYKKSLNENKTILIKPYSASHVAWFYCDSGCLPVMKKIKVKIKDFKGKKDFKLI